MYVFRLLDLRYEQNVLLNLARQGAGKWPTTRSAVSCKIAEKLPPYATHVLYNLIRYYINVSFHKIPTKPIQLSVQGLAVFFIV